MKYFDSYVSNSVAGSANQLFFASPEKQTGRVFYRISCGGRFEYSLLFSNIIDSTFADGSKSRKNRICEEWQIHSARMGKLRRDAIPPKFTSPEEAERINGAVVDFYPLTFDGQAEKSVCPGEFFASDPVIAEYDEGDYLCLEVTASGPMIPYHEESLLPAFVQSSEGWRYRKTTPFAGMIGCRRPVRCRVGFLGDSITQGIGAPANSYLHWNALIAERAGNDFAFWNLGIGYGRADDMASDGAWLYKARQNDLVVLCAGVNDLNRDFSAEQICENLNHITDVLLSCGIKVAVQTVPPFDYDEARTARWTAVNRWIREDLSQKVSLVFDVVPVLGRPDAPHLARYGGHPGAEGSALWAEGLEKVLFPLLDSF